MARMHGSLEVQRSDQSLLVRRVGLSTPSRIQGITCIGQGSDNARHEQGEVGEFRPAIFKDLQPMSLTSAFTEDS